MYEWVCVFVSKSWAHITHATGSEREEGANEDRALQASSVIISRLRGRLWIVSLHVEITDLVRAGRRHPPDESS